MGTRKSVGYGVSSLLRRVCRPRRDVRSPHHPWRFQRNRQRQCLRDGHFLYDIPTPLSSPHAGRVLSTCSNQSLAISRNKVRPPTMRFSNGIFIYRVTSPGNVTNELGSISLNHDLYIKDCQTRQSKRRADSPRNGNISQHKYFSPLRSTESIYNRSRSRRYV